MANSEVGKSIAAGTTAMEFTNSFLNGRKLIRSPKSPMDKCTVVSIFPKPIDEYKCTIEPGRFKLDAGSFESPSILVVGASSWWREIDADQPMLEIPVSSVQIADSVVKDYCNGMLGCNMDDAMPGLFFVQGPFNAFEIREKFKGKLSEIKARQDNWYKILVRLADSLWSRTNQNPLTISDEMRIAAVALNLDKPWLKDFQAIEKIRCFACGTLKEAEFPVCPSCRAIDPKSPLAKDIKFATV